jgi:hypothetical protein
MEKWKDRCRYEESITAGYFDKEQKEMVVRTDRESPSTRLHEVVHAYAEPSVDEKLTRYAKEGLTEYITRQVIARHKTAKNEKRLAFSQSYSGPYDLMLELSLIAGDDALAKAHFQGDIESLANAVGKPVFDSILADMESIDGWQEAVKHLRERKSKQVKIQKKAATRTQEKEWTSRPPQIAQRQIAVGQADDRFEMEADDVAERVMRSSSKEPHTRSRAATKENEIEISRKPNRVEDGNTAHHEKVEIDAQMHGGVPLPSPVRAFFEPIFGHDFSQVRVHTDDRAVESAESVGALAYTAGHDIVFGKGQYAPFTHSGQKLLAHELTHVRQQSHQAGVSTLQRALTAPPKRLITSYSETPSYPTDDEARLDARIAYRQAQALDSGTGMRLGTTDYKNLPQPTPVDPKKPADPNANIERRAVKSAILELVTSDPSVFADSEFRLRVPIDDSPAPYKYAMVVLRFDKDRNVEASYAGTLQESKGSLTDSQFVLPDLTATFGITFKTDSITAKMPGDSAATTFNGKEWSSNDGALLKEALPLLGANERAIISGKIFRRINLDKYKDVAGFYSTGDKSVNLMDSALPWDKSIWFGEGANFYSRAVHTVLHEIGHALHYATAPLTGAAASTKTLMDLFKSAVFAQSKKLTGKASATTWPPASIKFPTDYASTSWEEFYADSFSIYKTNPSFLATTDYQYLFDFFKLNFP